MLRLRLSLFLCAFILFSVFSYAKEQDDKFDRIVVIRNKLENNDAYSLSQKDLQNLPFSHPIEALNTTFVNLQSRLPVDSMQADFSLRGSNYQGVRILLNGQRINDPQTGHHNSDIPVTKEDISNISILSNISPLGVGPDAVGGTVNFITKKPEGRRVTLELSAGEYASYGQLLSISNKIKDLGFRFSVENKASKGFSDDTDFKKFTANMASTLDFSSGEINLNFGYQEKEFGAYDFYTPGLGYPSREWTRTYLLNSSLNLDKGEITIKPNFLWRRHFDKFMLDKTGIRSKYLVHHRTDMYTPGIYLSKDTSWLGKVGLGLEYSQEKISSTILGGHLRSQESIFIDNSFSFSDYLSLNSAFRIDDYDGKGLLYTGAAKVSFKYREESFLYMGISKAMRIPSFTELYYDDPTTVGNPNLFPEKSLTYEAGVSFKEQKFFISSALFFRDEDNFIDWVKSDSLQLRWEAHNIASSGVLGFEEYIQYTFSDRLNLKINYAYTNKSRDSKGYIYKYGENYARHLTSIISVFNLGFFSQEFGITYKKAPCRSGWFLAHIRLSYRLNKNSNIFLSATNIFNVEYQEIAGIPSPGRWIEGGLRVKW